MNERVLLDRAFKTHRKHGAHLGMNFVECAKCQFHVHSGESHLIKHWITPESYGRVPITSTSDPRIN